MENWLKLLHSFPRSPKIRALCRELRVSHHAALGLAVQWLLWIDEQSTEGETQLTPEEMDDELNKHGATAALCSIGWARVDEFGLVHAVDFGKHCGASAKKRAQTARRVGAHRRRCNAPSVTDATKNALAEEEYINIEEEVVISSEVKEEPPQLPDTPPPPLQDSPNLCPRPQAAAGAADAASFPAECRAWCRAVCNAVPAFSRLQRIPPDSREAILTAWRALPSAAEPAAVEALRSFYAADETDPAAAKLWRPEKLRSFFLGLHDVLANAERYHRRRKAAEAAARKVQAAKAAKAAKAAAEAAATAAAEAEFETPEDRIAFFRSINPEPQPETP